MNNSLFRRIFSENNLIIVVPAIIVVLMITAFMIYGLQDPPTGSVTTVDSILTTQQQLEEAFQLEYKNGEYTKTEPYFILNPYDISPLTALLLFETDDIEQFEIVVKGNTEEADIVFHTIPTTIHQVPIHGLYANQVNTIQLYEYDGVERGNILTTITTTTDPLPEGVAEPSSITTTYEYFGDDWMMLSPATSNLPVAIDAFGDVRWYSTTPLGFGMKQLENGHYLTGTNRIMSDPYYTTGLFELDLLGKVYTEYVLPGGYHHDMLELPDGNLLVLSNDFNGTVEDIVVEVDRATGDIVASWDIGYLINPFEGMTQMWTTSDWFHNNSIDYDPITDTILLSGRHQDVVIGIGKSSHELNYIIGDPDNWSSDFDDYFFTPEPEEFEWSYAQHSAIFVDSNTIMMFDNGNNRSKYSETYVSAADNYSRGVLYQIDTDAMKIEQLYQFGKEFGSSFYSPYISNVVYYDEGHYMIHSGGIAQTINNEALNVPAPLYGGEEELVLSSTTIEVQDGSITYSLTMADHYYQARRISPYDDNTVFRFGFTKQLGNQSETSTVSSIPDEKLTIFHDVPPKYQFTLLKEESRLIVEGVFQQADMIYLILENDNEQIIYSIPTSRTAYTAMCTAVFQGDDRFITYYINEEGVSGEYRVYVSINGHRYNSYQVVTFE